MTAPARSERKGYTLVQAVRKFGNDLDAETGTAMQSSKLGLGERAVAIFLMSANLKAYRP